MSAPTVLVIGATGRTGRHVVDGLLAEGVRVRALVRRPLTAALPDAVDVVPGALEDLDALATAARGADAAFLLWPSFDATGGQQVVNTLTAQVDHVVYLSAAQLQGDESGVVPGVYAEIEGLLERSDASWTFVRAGGFAANTQEWAEQIRGGDTVRIPYPGATRSLVDDRDLAEVSVRALLDPGLRGAAVSLTGPEALTQRQQVATIGLVLGRDLSVLPMGPDEAKAEYAAVLGSDFAEQALAYWASLEEQPERVTDDIERVLGRPARSFAEWVRFHQHDFERLDTRTVAEQYASGFRTGRIDESIRLMGAEMVRVAPLEDGEPEVRGPSAILENAERQSDGTRLDAVQVADPLIGDDRFAIRFTFSETVRATGRPRTVEKLSLCTVSGSRIVREEVFYLRGP